MEPASLSEDLSHYTDQIGASPGEIAHIEPSTTPPDIQIIVYDEQSIEEYQADSAEETIRKIDPERLTWINVEDIQHPDLVKKLGRRFSLHPLTVEDIVTPGQRPKVEVFDHYLYVVLQMLHLDERHLQIVSEQVSLIIGDKFLISFQEEIPGDVFDPIRRRLKTKMSRLRSSETDYLGYALIDVVIDQYFAIAENVGDRIDILQEHLLETAQEDLPHQINTLRHNLTYVRKWIWPLRNVVSHLESLDHPLLHTSTRPYFRDAYDHTIQVVDFIGVFHETLGGLLELYQSVTSNRLNEVMKVLTIIGTIFIPLTFIAGVYGMNFEHMPELEWRYGYPLLMGVMAIIAVSLLMYFRRKDWM